MDSNIKNLVLIQTRCVEAWTMEGFDVILSSKIAKTMNLEPVVLQAKEGVFDFGVISKLIGIVP